MDILDAILGRRSIRKYKDKAIDREIIENIIKLSMYAPSACNQQPWHFIIVNNKELLTQISSIHPHASMAKKAPLAIIICGDERSLISPNHWPQDCSAATQNLLLAAYNYAIGSVWCGLYPDKERIKKFQILLKIEPKVIPFSLVVLGYPDENPLSQDRFNKDKIHINKW